MKAWELHVKILYQSKNQVEQVKLNPVAAYLILKVLVLKGLDVFNTPTLLPKLYISFLRWSIVCVPFSLPDVSQL